MEFFEAEDFNPYLELFPVFSYIYPSLIVSSLVDFFYIKKKLLHLFSIYLHLANMNCISNNVRVCLECYFRL